MMRVSSSLIALSHLFGFMLSSVYGIHHHEDSHEKMTVDSRSFGGGLQNSELENSEQDQRRLNQSSPTISQVRISAMLDFAFYAFLHIGTFLFIFHLCLQYFQSLTLLLQRQAYLDRENTKVDGLVFLGVSLSRHSHWGHPGSATHQTAFDFNEIQDRDYEFVESTNDDGWLAGGGEPGPPTSYKLRAKDSSHIEIMRIGTHNPKWGGLKKADIIL